MEENIEKGNKEEVENKPKNKLLEWIENSSTDTIACCSAVVAVIYALIRFLINNYYFGKFIKLNIPIGFLKVNYGNVVYSAIFIFAILFFSSITKIYVKEKFTNNTKDESNMITCKEKVQKIILKLIIFIPASFMITVLFYIIFKIDVSIKLFITIFLISYILNLILYFIYSIEDNFINKIKGYRDNLFAMLSIFLMVSCMICLWGYSDVDKLTTFKLTSDHKYAITYNNDEYFVLHKATIDGKDLIIDKNKQKIIPVEDCEYEVMRFDNIEIISEND